MVIFQIYLRYQILLDVLFCLRIHHQLLITMLIRNHFGCSTVDQTIIVRVEGRNGFENEAGEEFCNLLDTILQNPELCQAAGAQSAQISANFDKTVFAQRIESVYENILA